MSVPARSAAEIRAWMTQHVAKLLDVQPVGIDPGVSLHEYGLDSMIAVGLVFDLEEWLDQRLPDSILWEYPTIEQLSAHLGRAG